MAFIVDSLIPDTNHLLQLGNEEFVRRLGFGTGWTKIRVGVRLCLNDSQTDILTGSFALGLCEGVGAGFKAQAASKWVGFIPGAYPIAQSVPMYPTDLWNRTVNGYYICTGAGSAGAGNGNLAIKTGNGLYLQFCNMANLTWFLGYRATYVAAGASTGYIFYDFSKVGTSIVFTPFFAYSSGWGNRTSADLYAGLRTIGAPGGLSSYGPFSVGYGSTLNQLDTLSIVWEKCAPTLEISDIAVARLY